MSSQWQDRRRFRGGTKPSPSLAFLFLASIVLLMMEPCCGSAIRGVTVSTEESNDNSNGNGNAYASYADRRRVLANDDGDENNGKGEGDQDEGDLDKDENEGENSGESDQEPTDAAASEETGTDVLAPGDEADSSDNTLPFLTDGDVLCLDSTTQFINQSKGLGSAIETFQGSQTLLKDGVTGVELFGYPEDTANVMKSACELNKGHWAFVKSMDLTCVIEAMETIPLHVHNFGRCLTKTDDCLEMDTTSLLRADLAELGFNCWEDDDEESSGDVDGDNGADTESVQDSESGGSAEENSDASETNPEADSAEGENNKDPDSDMDTGGQNPSDDMDSEMADIFADMGLSESDTNCMTDSAKIAMDHPELEAAIEEYALSSDIDINGSSLTMKYSSNAADKLRSVCTDSTIGGYFSDIKKAEFDCSMMGEELGLSMTNIANCWADTDECRSFNPLLLMEELWQSMGLTCIEPDADGTEQHSSSSAPHQNNNNNKNNNNLSSELKNESSSSSPIKLPQSFTTAAIVLGVVAALGFFGFYRYRASSGRERTVRSAYEMTNITDLGSESTLAQGAERLPLSADTGRCVDGSCDGNEDNSNGSSPKQQRRNTIRFDPGRIRRR